MDAPRATELGNMRCEACRSDSPAVSEDQYARLLSQLPGWTVVVIDSTVQITKQYTLANFVSALDLANRIGAVAEVPRITIRAWWLSGAASRSTGGHTPSASCI